MKKITLKSLTLINFRGEKERITNFNEIETSIIGDNGLGKSRHFDAFMWLLFGKDSQDRKDYNIKTIINGKSLDKVDSEVHGVLNVDGQDIYLRRSIVEKWVKPRGQYEEVFKGNETECYWNDTPVSVSEYQKRVNAIIDDSVFKMVTNPLFFANMKWQDQREQLFQLAGTISDNEIAAGSAEFTKLLDRISGKSLGDFKRELTSRKKRLKDDLAQIQPRIDQTLKLTPETADFNLIEANLKNLEDQHNQVDLAISDQVQAANLINDKQMKMLDEINKLKQERQQVLHDAITSAKEEAFKSNEVSSSIENKIRSTETKINDLVWGIRTLEAELKDLHACLKVENSQIELLRNDWITANEKEYTGDETCHCCGQRLPNDMIANARDLFIASKRKQLDEIDAKGSNFKNHIIKLQTRINEIDSLIDSKRKEMRLFEEEISNCKANLKQLPIVEDREINPNDIPKYAELSIRIVQNESKIATCESFDNSVLLSKKQELSNNINELRAQLNNRDIIAKCDNEVLKLKNDGKQLAQQIADLEREEFTIQAFSKAKIDECERRINGLFSFVKFQLFEYTIDGNESETCLPLVNGVPYPTVNSAGKVNAGLDIINALTNYYGIIAPIFIDGRESVNHLIPTQSQIINLIVSNDKQLVIK